MYEITKDRLSREALTREVVPLAAALVVSEIFYKLGSFTLEAVAFLATWYMLSRAWAILVGHWNQS